MAFHVVVNKKVLRGYIRRALKAYPKEYMETILGRINGQDIEIWAFQDIPHDGTKMQCGYDPGDLREQAEEAAAEDMILLGTIHSHTNGYDAPSDQDWKDSRMNNELLLGICAISKTPKGRRRVKVMLWPSTKPFELRITDGE